MPVRGPSPFRCDLHFLYILAECPRRSSESRSETLTNYKEAVSSDHSFDRTRRIQIRPSIRKWL